MTEDDFKVMWGEKYKTGDEMEQMVLRQQQLDIWKGTLLWTAMVLTGMGFWALVIIGVVLVATR